MNTRILRRSQRNAWIGFSAVLTVQIAAAQCGGQWLPTTEQGGLLGDSEVHAMTPWDPDGAGPERAWLVLGGELSQNVGGMRQWNVVAWDGAAWRAMASAPRQVNAFAVFQGDLYAGVLFESGPNQPASTVLRWTGTAWEPLGTLNESTLALAVYNGQLYAGGDFTEANGQPVNYIARWTGSTWQPLPGGGMDGRVLALEVFAGELVAGGDFGSAGGFPTQNIARWNGSIWKAVSGGVDGVVRCLDIHQDELVAAGLFTEAGGQSALRIAGWNGNSWHPFGGGLNDRVWTIASVGGGLYAGRQFTAAGGVPANFVAAWDGAAWAPLDAGTDGVVAALGSYDDHLIVGGYFDTAGEMPMRAVAQRNAQWQSWSTLESGFRRAEGRAVVKALASHHGLIYAGGDFGGVDGRAARNLAAWNGEAWQAVVGGTSGRVNALASITHAGPPPRTELIVGGMFDRVGGDPGEAFSIAASNIALYSTELNVPRWQALGSGTDGPVSAVAVFNGDLIAAGSFTHAGGISANRIARWTGVQWQRLSTGIGGTLPYVRALHVFDGDLIVAGGFQTAGDAPARNIARWTGGSWQAMGDGLDFSVSDLETYNGELFASGENVARWDGTQWQPLGLVDVGSYIHLAVHGEHLFASVCDPNFATLYRWLNPAGGWGSSEGLYNDSWPATVHAMLASNGELLVAGEFERVSGMPMPGLHSANGWARYSEINTPWIAFQPNSQTQTCGGTADFSTTAAMGYDGLAYEWRRDGVPLANGTSALGSIISGADTATLQIANVSDGDMGQYEVVVANDCGNAASAAATLTVTDCCTGDVNGDLQVSLQDLANLLAHFGQSSGASLADGDINGDGAVTLQDLAILLAHFGGVCP